MMFKTTHTAIRKWIRYLADYTELIPAAAWGQRVPITWQSDAIAHVLKMGMTESSVMSDVLTEARLIHWDVFDYITKLDPRYVNDRDDEDYAATTRDEYLRMLRAVAQLSPERELYLLLLNTRVGDHDTLREWGLAEDTDARWIGEEPAVDLAEAVATGRFLRNAIDGV